MKYLSFMLCLTNKLSKNSKLLFSALLEVADSSDLDSEYKGLYTGGLFRSPGTKGMKV